MSTVLACKARNGGYHTGRVRFVAKQQQNNVTPAGTVEDSSQRVRCASRSVDGAKRSPRPR